jgi:diaminohydroxyphosphoribosylaminopyrimidine deaminase/5-amino-6-(5-phosphoribosylamino)uracil reductase
LYVTLEPCSTTGRTPPCTEAILRAGIRRVVVAATDPNPAHAGRGLELLRQAGVRVDAGVLAKPAEKLNWAFNYWVVRRMPAVTVKAAMTLDGKLADAQGRSQWITGEKARAYAMRLRVAHDAVLVGVNTVLADDPALTLRAPQLRQRLHPWRRIILDPRARTPLTARVLQPAEHTETVVVVGPQAPKQRRQALAERAVVWEAPCEKTGFDLRRLLAWLGEREVTALLVEGGGETQAAFLFQGWAQRVAFFYAPKVLGGGASRRAVAGQGAGGWEDVLRLAHPRWRRLGEDWLLEAEVAGAQGQPV